MVTKEMLMNGIISYIDDEVMQQLPTHGKWAMGTMIGLASSNLSQTADELLNHPLVRMLGVVDSTGQIDSNRIIDALYDAAQKYGKLEVSLPIVGRMRFSCEDVERLRSYVGG